MDLYDLDKEMLQTFWNEKRSSEKGGQIKRNTGINEISDHNAKSRSGAFENKAETRDAEVFDVKI